MIRLPYNSHRGILAEKVCKDDGWKIKGKIHRKAVFILRAFFAFVRQQLSSLEKGKAYMGEQKENIMTLRIKDERSKRYEHSYVNFSIIHNSQCMIQCVLQMKE
jgi:hypothetical protein